MYPSKYILGISEEVARRERRCALDCRVGVCSACRQSSGAYLDSLSLADRVNYNAYMRAKPMLELVTA